MKWHRKCAGNTERALSRKKKLLKKKSNLIGTITVLSTSGTLCDRTNTLSIHSNHSTQTAGAKPRRHAWYSGINPLSRGLNGKRKYLPHTAITMSNGQRHREWESTRRGPIFSYRPGSNRSPTTTTFSIRDTSAENGGLTNLRGQKQGH